MYFSSYFLFLVMFFTLCFLGGPRRPVGRPKKTPFFSARKNVIFFWTEKMTFFRVRQYGAFWLQRSHCGNGYHISLPTGLNLESAEISTSKTCQFKTTNVAIHPAVPKVYTYLISFGQMEMANASENFGHTLVRLRPWNDAIHDFHTSVRNVFSGIWKNAVFSGHGSRMTVRKNHGWLAIWLARWLAGYLTIGFVAAWLGYSVISYLVGWLIGRLALALAVISLNGSLSGLLSGYLDGWLAIWLAS